MSTADTRFSALLEQFTGDLHSTNEDIRRRAVDEFYSLIIAQYADAPADVVTSIVKQVQEFVRKKLNNPSEINDNRAALLVILCFVCAGQNFYIELSNKLEPTLRGYKQMSVDANLCELVIKLTVILVKGCGRMSIDQFSHDVPKAIERIFQTEKHETRRYSGIIILKEIALAAPSRYYHLITPVEEFFEHLFGTMTDPKQYIREAFAETVHATLVVLIDREREEQKPNNNQSNTFMKAYTMAYNEAMKCLSKSTQNDERIHGELLLLNELLRVSNIEFENICQDLIHPYTARKPKPISYKDVHRARVALKFERTGRLLPMDIIDNSNQSQIQVQSSLIRSIMLENFLEICHRVFQYRQQSNPMIANVLIRILPRLASLNYQLFSHLDATMNFIFERIHSKDHQLAFHALGLMILIDKTNRINNTDLLIPNKIFECLQQTFIPTSQLAMINLLPCRYLSPDSSVFACITMIGEAGPDASKYFDNLLEQLLHCGLNHSLLFCLEKLCSMPLIHNDTKRKIHQGLLENLRLILSNSLSYNKNLTIEQIDIILITLQTLRRFDFEVQAIEPYFIDILNTRFIEHDIVRIRIESIITITYLLRKLLSQTITNKLHIKIGYITQRILIIGVTDFDPDVRYNIFLTLQDDFQPFLSKSQALELLLFSIHDECHEIKELALNLLGRLSNINPAYVLPSLRNFLLQLLTELEIGCSLNGKEQASKLLGQLIANTPRIVRSYMQLIIQTLLPLIKQHEQDSNVLIALVRTIGEYVQVCGINFDQDIHDIFPILINMMQDTSNYRKREIALWTIGQIVENCCYVIEPLQTYPILLDVLLQFLKSQEEIPFRRETIRVLGFLGAIDPYYVRSTNDSFRSLSSDITLTHRVRFQLDPIEKSSNELLISSNSQSLHDFYTSMAIYVCLRILKDSNTPQLHLKAIQSITKILQWLGNTSTQYVSLVLPCLLSVVRNTDDRNLVTYFHQINIIIISIKHSIIDYMNDIIQLIGDYWNRHSDLQILLIQTIESLSIALDNQFCHYIHLLLPFFMNIFRDVQINRQLILSQIFSTLNKFGRTLKPHFNMILPSILDIASTNTYPIKLRQEALDTIEQLAEKIYLSDYVSAVLQILLRIIRKTPQLQIKCLDIILIIAQQMGKHFLVFNSLVSKTMNDMKLQHSKYELYISKLKDSSFIDVQTEESNQSLNLITSNEQIKKSDDKIIYTIRTEQLRLHWSQAKQRNAKDLPMWLNKFQQLVLEQSPVYPLKAVSTCLAQDSPSISRDLFNVSFISCWNELNSHDRLSLTNALTYVLSVCDKPDVIQIILNLAEFQNHCDFKLKFEQSLIDIHLLSEKAFSVRAYAKALRYKEEEFQSESITSDTIESLISINHELQQSEAAYGALEYAKHHHIKIQDLWYEKLNQWECALKNYEFLKTNDPLNMDIHFGCMRCMQALGSWGELKDLASQLWKTTELIHDDQPLNSLPFSTSLIEKNFPSISTFNGRELKKILREKIAPMATRAAWSLGDMIDMKKYYIHIPNTKFEGAYYRAVDAIRNDNYRQAQDSIDLTRELLDVELTTLANESYNRAYSAMINAQLLSELEEVWYYKIFPERRQSICEIWQKRMQGNQPIIDDYHRLLLTHSLCIPMTEDFQSWIKLANLCRRSNRLTMANFIFKQLDHQTNPFVKYEKAKYDWQCLSSKQNHRQDQLKLIDDMKEMIVHRVSQPDLRQLISKCYLRLGTWQYDLFGMTNDDMLTEIMKNYERAWTNDESNCKAWNAYAVLNYDAVNYFKNSQQEILDRSNENSRKLTPKMIDYTISAVKGLLKSIILSKAKYCLQNTLRLLTIWFEYGQHREVYDVLSEGIRTVPIEVWLQVLPQLIARIDSLVHQSIYHLLIDIGRQHPQALIYSLVVASKSVVRERKIAANRVLNNMREHSHTLVQQAMIVSEELIRISILWHEKWREGLETVGKYLTERNIQGMIDTLEPLHATIERGSTTLNERKFLDSYSNDLTEAHEYIRNFQRSRDQRELHQAWRLYYQVFRRINDQLTNITSLELDSVSPRLATHCRDLELAVPGTYEPHKPPITIRNVHAHINVITSKRRPRKISITGSDGYEYVFLLKGHEDLRQDERVMQLLGLVNEFLSANDETHRRNFIIQRYPVIPLAPNNGLLGWVDQCDTFHVLIKEYREKAGIIFDAEVRHMLDKAPHYEQLPLINKIEVFEYALNLLDGNDLAKILWHKSSSAEIWLDRRSNYTRSLAVMSMVGYILGLGDRHPSNLMLDRASGKVVHIDFGDCFEVAMVREKFAEKVPFRLTRMLRKAMEVTGIDGTFRMTCEHVMDVLRKNRDSLMAVLEAFVHDPLLNWRLLENNNVSTSVTSNHSHLSTVNEEDESTIGGTAQPGRTIRAVEIMNRVREKLTGSDFHREQPVDIPTQVELLIKQATSHENLCQSFTGWCPFW